MFTPLTYAERMILFSYLKFPTLVEENVALKLFKLKRDKFEMDLSCKSFKNTKCLWRIEVGANALSVLRIELKPEKLAPSIHCFSQGTRKCCDFLVYTFESS